MAEFTQVRKKGPTIKYPEHQQTLVEMGFDTIDVSAALDTVSGNIEFAMAVLLGEPIPTIMGGSYTSRALAPMKVVGKSQSTSSSKLLNKPDIKDVHNKFMATYKIQKCKEKNSHDKRMCTGYHTKGDRRRNPFDVLYACTECPTSPTETTNCPDGDACLKAHNMLERMFHPELFKISMCQRGPNGSHCERGNLCAFAHSDEDHRIPLSHTLNKAAQLAAIASEPLAAGKSIGDSRMLDSVQDKLIRLIKSQGTEGIISSELPKRFSDVYSERLDLTDEAGEKFRIKDLLLAHPCISVTMHKGVQPKYVWGEERYYNPHVIMAPIMPIVELPKPVVSLILPGTKPATSWASAVSSPQAAPVTADNVDINSRGRRRGPPLAFNSNFSLETDGYPLGSLSADASLYPSDNIISFDSGASPEYNGSMDYKGASLGFGSLPPAPGLSGLLTAAALGTGPSGRRRGPSGPPDDYLGTSPTPLVFSSTGSPLVPPGFSSNNMSSPSTEATSMGEYAERLKQANNVCNALQTQVNSLQGDLTQKSREFDLKNFELKEIIDRLEIVEESNSDSSETKDTLSVEIIKIRSELFTTQQLLRQKEDELLKTEEVLKEVDAALHAALTETESVAESSKNLLMPEIHNLRAKLNAVEIEYENSRAHASELDRARNMLLAEVDSLRSQLGGGARSGISPAEMQLQQTNAALAHSNRDREELIEYITKMTQQTRGIDETNAMREHLRARFNGSGGNGNVGSNNGNYQNGQNHQASSNNGWENRIDGDEYTNNHNNHMQHHNYQQNMNQQNQGNQSQNNYMNGGNINPMVCALPSCNVDGLYMCACQTVRYCGEDHQREHWSFHMAECRIKK